MKKNGSIIGETVIMDNIKLRITEVQHRTGERTWDFTVIYDDKEEIEFGCITVFPGYGCTVTEYYAFDNNYIYTYYENGYKADDVAKIFDLKAKREILNTDERDIIYSEFLSIRNLNLTNIRERNQRAEKENQRIREQK